MRRALLHPIFASPAPDQNIVYSEHPSTKIDLFVEILQYHLAQQGRPPLQVANPGMSNDLVPNLAAAQPEGTVLTTPTRADKIVGFLMFPSSMWIVAKALKEKGIKFVSITGKNSPTKRATILEDFRKSKTHHVLIISSVGTTGLNMWFARVLVILVRLFSLLKICY